jgi:hypothetical protein
MQEPEIIEVDCLTVLDKEPSENGNGFNFGTVYRAMLSAGMRCGIARSHSNFDPAIGGREVDPRVIERPHAIAAVNKHGIGGESNTHVSCAFGAWCLFGYKRPTNLSR